MTCRSYVPGEHEPARASPMRAVMGSPPLPQEMVNTPRPPGYWCTHHAVTAPLTNCRNVPGGRASGPRASACGSRIEGGAAAVAPSPRRDARPTIAPPRAATSAAPPSPVLPEEDTHEVRGGPARLVAPRPGGA